MQDEADGIEARIAVYESIKSKEDGIENIKKYLQAQKQKLEHADNKVKQGLIDAFVQRVTVYDDHFDLVLTVDSDKDGGGEGDNLAPISTVLHRFGMLPNPLFIWLFRIFSFNCQ